MSRNAHETNTATQNAEYEQAMIHYESAVRLLRKRDFDGARELFLKVPQTASNEPELAERAATYVRICETKTRVVDRGPIDAAARYHHAVLLTNRGDLDAAIELLTETLAVEPTSVNCLYVRACCWALKGAPEKAVSDLREAMAIDPRVRYQAINDPDFEKIREEPSFIDIIEPTPAGA